MKRKWIFSLLVLVLALTACGGNDDEESENNEAQVTDEAPSYTVALVMKTLTNPFFVEMEKGARQAEEDFSITLVVKTAAQEDSIEQQIAIVDELIQDKVDAIVIAPGDSQALIPALKKAQDAGIVVINIDNRLDPELSTAQGLVNVPFISVDNETGGYLSAKFIADQVSEPTQALIFEGIRTAQNAEDRKNGAIRAFDENENIEVVAMESANWKIEEANTLAQTLFEAHPDVKLVFCANDMMALGVINYLQTSGKTDMQIAAYDALAEAKEAIKAGTLAATIDQQAARQGYLGVEYAIKALRGEELPAETMVDVLLVTAENVEL